jgi:hypothetical protein
LWLIRRANIDQQSKRERMRTQLDHWITFNHSESALRAMAGSDALPLPERESRRKPSQKG